MKFLDAGALGKMLKLKWCEKIPITEYSFSLDFTLKNQKIKNPRKWDTV